MYKNYKYKKEENKVIYKSWKMEKEIKLQSL